MLKKILLGLIVGVLVIGGVMWNKGGLDASQPEGDKVKLTMYKSPNCGCCVGHAAYLKSKGYGVEIVKTEDMASVKEEYQIPSEMESCHTITTEDYFIEGHVPVKAIEKLLAEKPKVEGIGLAGMPAGSPGMPGVKQEVWEILSLKMGEIKEWMKI